MWRLTLSNIYITMSLTACNRVQGYVITFLDKESSNNSFPHISLRALLHVTNFPTAYTN
jgi:hypothetical protein